MSLLSKLRPAKGSKHNSKRLGRGSGSGKGGTSGKGHKGLKARTGGKVRRGYEGGQMPLHMRLPKIGFNNPFKVKYQVVNLDKLNAFSGTVTPETLAEGGLAKSKTPVKVLGRGKIEKALTVKAHCFSETAKQAIEKAGGKIEVIK